MEIRGKNDEKRGVLYAKVTFPSFMIRKVFALRSAG
uniref:Uncharacterized protein n=1 Tax=Ascaris lumbricoides TaxID=6252 RepID=A0A0M3ITQ4_ASCLU